MNEVQKILAAYTLIHQTSKLTNAYREQRNKYDNEKTWNNLKLHFSKEFKDYKDKLNTSTTSECKANLTANTTESTDLQHHTNQVQDKAIQDLTNFNQVQARHNELILKMEQRNNEIDYLKKPLLELKNLVKHNNCPNPTNNSSESKKIVYRHYSWTYSHT